MVMSVTITIKTILFWRERMKFISFHKILKLSNPTNTLLLEKPPHLYKDILNTSTVGKIIKMVNKISAGDVQAKIKILFSVVLFMDITSFNKYNGEEGYSPLY